MEFKLKTNKEKETKNESLLKKKISRKKKNLEYLEKCEFDYEKYKVKLMSEISNLINFNKKGSSDHNSIDTEYDIKYKKYIRVIID